MQVCEDWFTRMRMLLLRTSAAAKAPHLTLHHAYARLADLKSQLRHLQAAAAAEAAQQLQEQLQAQRQQAQLEEAQAAQQLAETQMDTQSPHPAQTASVPDTSPTSSTGNPALQQPQFTVQQQEPLVKKGGLCSKEGVHPISGQAHRQSQAAALAAASVGSQSHSSAQQPPVAPSSTAAAPSKEAAAPAISLLTGQPQQASRPAPIGLLEIQAEQEAEAARAAEAAKAAKEGRGGRGRQTSEGHQSSRASSAAASQPGQPRVLQVGAGLHGQRHICLAASDAAWAMNCLMTHVCL